MRLIILLAFCTYGFRLILNDRELIDQQPFYQNVIGSGSSVILSDLINEQQKKLYNLSEWSLNMKDGTSISIQEGAQPQISFDNFDSMLLDVDLNTGWSGNLTVLISGYKQINGTQQQVQRKYSTPLGPFLNYDVNIQRIKANRDSLPICIESGLLDQHQFRNLYDDIKMYSSSINKHLKPQISNWFLSNIWILATLNFLGSKVIPQNLSYFIGFFSCLQVRFMTLDSKMSDCFQCQEDVPPREYFYLIDSDEGLAKTSRFRNLYYSDNVILNLDWTLAWAAFAILIFVILRFLRKEIELASSFIFGTLDGSIFEISLFSLEVIYRQSTRKQLDILYFAISLALLAATLIYSFKPLVYHILVDFQAASQEPVSRYRRGTSYPGKSFQINQRAFLSAFYSILYESTRGQEGNKRFKRAVLFQYFGESFLQFGLAFALIIWEEASDFLIAGLSLFSLQVLIQMVFIYEAYVLHFQNNKLIIIIGLLKSVEYLLLLCVFATIYVNEYLIGLTSDNFQVANINYTSQEISPLYRPEFKKDIDQINDYGNLCINLLYPYLVLQIIQLILRAYICAKGLNGKPKEPHTLDVQERGQMEFYMQSAGPMRSFEIVSPRSMKKNIEGGEQIEQLKQNEETNNQQLYITPTPIANDKEIEIEMTEVKYTKIEDENEKQNFIVVDTFAVNEFNTTKKEINNGQTQLLSNMNTNSNRKSAVVYDTQQMQVVMPKRESLVVSRLFGNGTIKINKGEMAAIYDFEQRVYLGDLVVTKAEFQMMKDFDEENMKLFVQEMRIVGIHTIQLKNISKSETITISKLKSQIISENRIGKTETYDSLQLQPGSNYEIKLNLSFDFFTDEQLDDRIEIKGVYQVEADPPVQRRIKIELCNSQMRLIQVLPYDSQQLIKLKKANKDQFVLVYEEKILKYNQKNADSYISHHKLLRIDLEKNMQASFARLKLILPNSPRVSVHMILEQETDGYLLISIFMKKSSSALKPGCKFVLVTFGAELLQFLREF